MSTLYERLGGAPAIEAALEHFYGRVLDDPELAPFFEAVDVKAMNRKQEVFLGMAFGGPQEYTGPGLNAVHADVRAGGLNDEHVDRFLEHFEATLTGLGVDSEGVAEVMAIANGARDDVLDRA